VEECTNLGPAENGTYANGSLPLEFSTVNLKGLNSYNKTFDSE